MRRPIRVLALLAVLSLAACMGTTAKRPSVDKNALAKEAALRTTFERAMKDEARVYSLAFPLLSANAEYCGSYTRPVIGLSAWNIHSVSNTYRPAAKKLYSLDDRLIVKTIARKSPAQKAGILAGDVIESINGESVSGASAVNTFDSAVLDSAGQAVKIGVRRSGRAQVLTVAPVSACNFPIRVDHESNDMNADSSGNQIVISRGIIRFTGNDEELALVIAHELAHNALSNVSKLRQNAMAGSLGSSLIDSLMGDPSDKNTGFEQEADYIGMYFMERSGYNAANVAPFWRRLAEHSTSHPVSPKRFRAIDATYKEIMKKKATGQKVAPTLKK